MSRLNRLLTAKTVRSSYMEDEVDQHGADELRLFIDNDADLYRQQYIPIVQNLMRKRAAKVYDSEKAVTLFMYLVESGAKKYAKEAGSPDQPWHVMFPKETRLDTARQLRDHFEGEADLGNWDHYIPKKYGGTGKYKEVPKGALEAKLGSIESANMWDVTIRTDSMEEANAVSKLFDEEDAEVLSDGSGVVVQLWAETDAEAKRIVNLVLRGLAKTESTVVLHAEADEIEVTDPEEAKKVDDVLKKSGAKATTMKSGKSIKYRFANKSEYDKATKELSKEATGDLADQIWDRITDLGPSGKHIGISTPEEAFGEALEWDSGEFWAEWGVDLPGKEVDWVMYTDADFLYLNENDPKAMDKAEAFIQKHAK